MGILKLYIYNYQYVQKDHIKYPKSFNRERKRIYLGNGCYFIKKDRLFQNDLFFLNKKWYNDYSCMEVFYGKK